MEYGEELQNVALGIALYPSDHLDGYANNLLANDPRALRSEYWFETVN
jgi:hypothetical protein